MKIRFLVATIQFVAAKIRAVEILDEKLNGRFGRINKLENKVASLAIKDGTLVPFAALHTWRIF